jgi:hypothetical protein
MIKKINHRKLYTQTEYSKKSGLSKQMVHYNLYHGKLTKVEINGAVLVLED